MKRNRRYGLKKVHVKKDKTGSPILDIWNAFLYAIHSIIKSFLP